LLRLSIFKRDVSRPRHNTMSALAIAATCVPGAAARRVSPNTGRSARSSAPSTVHPAARRLVATRALKMPPMDRLMKENRTEDVGQWESCLGFVMGLGLDDVEAEKVLVRACGWCVLRESSAGRR